MVASIIRRHRPAFARARAFTVALTAAAWAAALAVPAVVRAEPRPLENAAFVVTDSLTVPGSPERVYDALTGDVSGWWDHTFSDKPHQLYIEPWPGGGFFEIFDPGGDGVLHATVTWAQRGKRLRMEGPLGLTGRAIVFVSTLDLAARGDSTQVRLEVHCAGEALGTQLSQVVSGVWRHFLYEGLLPYLVAGKDRQKQPWPRPQR